MKKRMTDRLKRSGAAAVRMAALILCASVVFTGCQSDAPEAGDRAYEDQVEVTPAPAVSVTIDDLPVGSRIAAFDERRRITDDLLEKVTRYDVPAVGFVIERLLYNDGELQPREVELLESWLEAGLELANHTHSHNRFDETPMEEYQEDILRGDEVTRPLMEEYGMDLHYFRHPFLSYGDDPQRRKELNRFLDDHGYTVAPVTVDTFDWYYDRAYLNALRAGDEELADRIADDYIRHTEEVFRHSRDVTRKALGREPAQILLLHAVRINADHFHRVAEVILELGYEFVSLEEALDDELYSQPLIRYHPSTLSALGELWEAGVDPAEWEMDEAMWEGEFDDTDLDQFRRPSVPEWVSEHTDWEFLVF